MERLPQPNAILVLLPLVPKDVPGPNPYKAHLRWFERFIDFLEKICDIGIPWASHDMHLEQVALRTHLRNAVGDIKQVTQSYPSSSPPYILLILAGHGCVFNGKTCLMLNTQSTWNGVTYESTAQVQIPIDEICETIAFEMRRQGLNSHLVLLVDTCRVQQGIGDALPADNTSGRALTVYSTWPGERSYDYEFIADFYHVATQLFKSNARQQDVNLPEVIRCATELPYRRRRPVFNNFPPQIYERLPFIKMRNAVPLPLPAMFARLPSTFNIVAETDSLHQDFAAVGLRGFLEKNNVLIDTLSSKIIKRIKVWVTNAQRKAAEDDTHDALLHVQISAARNGVSLDSTTLIAYSDNPVDVARVECLPKGSAPPSPQCHVIPSEIDEICELASSIENKPVKITDLDSLKRATAIVQQRLNVTFVVDKGSLAPGQTGESSLYPQLNNMPASSEDKSITALVKKMQANQNDATIVTQCVRQILQSLKESDAKECLDADLIPTLLQVFNVNPEVCLQLASRLLDISFGLTANVQTTPISKAMEQAFVQGSFVERVSQVWNVCEPEYKTRFSTLCFSFACLAKLCDGSEQYDLYERGTGILETLNDGVVQDDVKLKLFRIILFAMRRIRRPPTDSNIKILLEELKNAKALWCQDESARDRVFTLLTTISAKNVPVMRQVKMSELLIDVLGYTSETNKPIVCMLIKNLSKQEECRVKLSSETITRLVTSLVKSNNIAEVYEAIDAAFNLSLYNVNAKALVNMGIMMNLNSLESSFPQDAVMQGKVKDLKARLVQNSQ